MATFRKIYNGMEMEGCALYEYLLTSKGFCCEKGWNWEDLDTQMTMTGRDWLAYWALNGSPCAECEAPINTVLPTISGLPVVGQTLTAGDGTWSGTAPITYTYQWKRNGFDIVGATNGIYIITIDDIGADITLEVVANNACAGGGVSAVSGTFGPISDCTSPSFTTPVAIDGDSIVGATLSVSDNGQPSGTAPITITYQWNLNGTPIGGATADTYEVQPADAGGNITCTVTATNACGNDSGASNSIGPISAGYILDTVSGGQGAWSVARQLKSSATNAIRIRRSNDNAEQDIGFVSGVLDTAAITSFVGSNSAYVTKLYDQSGNGRDISNSTATEQSRIVDAGTIITKNSKNAIDGVNSSLIGYSAATAAPWKFLHDGTESSVYMVRALSNTPFTINVVTTGPTNPSATLGFSFSLGAMSSVITDNGGSSVVQVFKFESLPTNGTQTLLTWEIDADNPTAADRIKYYKNNGSAVKGNSATIAPSSSDPNSPLLIQLFPYSTEIFQELIIFNTQPDLATMRSNINGFYNIY